MPLRTHNRDTGSLNVGATEVRVGDSIHIAGEPGARTVTYVMGRPARANLHAVCRGTGQMPLGDVEFTVLRAGVPIAPGAGPVARAASPAVHPRSHGAALQTARKTSSAQPAAELSSPLRRCWSGPDHRPLLVLHSDWSMHPRKRRQAEAILEGDGRYLAFATQATPSPDRVLQELHARTPAASSVLAGFDFAIGLPRAYAEQVGVAEFLTLFPRLGSGPWKDFFLVADTKREISLRRPFYPRSAATKGSATHAHLCAALGARTMDDLRRVCDLASKERPAAEVLFWTLGAKQVGKGVISGWREMLQPSRRTLGDWVRLWPFEGALNSLVAPGRLVVVETYPAEFYRHFGFKVSKQDQTSRKGAAKVLLTWTKAAGVRLTPSLEAQLNDGFGASKDGEDDFDAVVGLFGMLNVVLGHRAPGDPTEDAVKRIEGWMFGIV
jgi:hypothetical protein